MNYNNTDLVNLLLNTSDAKAIIPSEIKKAVNTLLATELTEFLKSAKHSVDSYNTDNSRNGYYSRTLSTSYGDISISVPRVLMLNLNLLYLTSMHAALNH